MSPQSEADGPFRQAIGEPTIQLRLVGRIATGAMALTLLLPWLGSWWEWRSYLSLCAHFLAQISHMQLPASFMEWVTAANAFGAFIFPAIATLIAIDASLLSLKYERESSRSFAAYYLYAGLTGLLGALAFCWTVLDSRQSVVELGCGVVLFGVASLAVLVVGIASKKTRKGRE
jgi:hypothetical protein